MQADNNNLTKEISPKPTAKGSQFPTVIIGGGIAGLTAALHLSERGLKPLVLEADPEFCGGRWGAIAAERLPTQGEWVFPAEHGIHGLWWQYKNLKAMAQRYNFMPDLILANRQLWVHGEASGKVRSAEMGRGVRRTLWPAPFHYGALFFHPTFFRMITFRDIFASPIVLGSLLTALGVDPLIEARALEGATLADFCKGWSPRMTAFLASLARSGLSAHPEDVPLAGFIAFLRFYSALRRDSQRFHFLSGNPQTLFIEPMLKRIVEFGGEVRKGTRVVRMERWNKMGWKLYLESGETLEAAHVILATDAPSAHKLLAATPATREVTENMTWPQGLETAVVRYWFSEALPKRAVEAGIISGDFAIDNFFWLHCIQAEFVKWHKATGGSAIEAHIYNQESLALDDAALLVKVEQNLARLFPTLKGKVIHATLHRNEATHTLFGVGSLAQHIGVRTPWPGLSCCGDWVRHPIPALFLERACATGIAAANVVLEMNQQAPFPLKNYDKPELLARFVGLWVKSVRGTVKR
ncbi:MAG: FAD-dependent oxidoreductase [Chloroflexota bacterium]|nr:FAD-dependent oxidoreductase [Chloroflexota bacterium]